jgi:hypothetical protein
MRMQKATTERKKEGEKIVKKLTGSRNSVTV